MFVPIVGYCSNTTFVKCQKFYLGDNIKLLNADNTETR